MGHGRGPVRARAGRRPGAEARRRAARLQPRGTRSTRTSWASPTPIPTGSRCCNDLGTAARGRRARAARGFLAFEPCGARAARTEWRRRPATSASVQMLDGTVAIHRLRLVRGDDAPLAWHRTYVFDYTADGYQPPARLRRPDRRSRGHRRARPAGRMSPPSDGRPAPALDGLRRHARSGRARRARRGLRREAHGAHRPRHGRGHRAAAAPARGSGIGFVAGVELSVRWRGRSLHVLGLAHRPGRAAHSRPASRRNRSCANRARSASPRSSRRPARRDARRSRASVPPAACRPARISRARSSRSAPRRTSARPSTAGSAAASPGHVSTPWPELAEAHGLDHGGRRQGGDRAPDALHALGRRAARAVHRIQGRGRPGVEVDHGRRQVRDREQAISLAVRCGLEGSVGSDFHDPGDAVESAGSIG